MCSMFITVNLKKKNEVKPDPISLKPDALSKELFCVGCIALSIEMVRILKGRKTESDVYHALHNVCKDEYKQYRIYLLTCSFFTKRSNRSLSNFFGFI